MAVSLQARLVDEAVVDKSPRNRKICPNEMKYASKEIFQVYGAPIGHPRFRMLKVAIRDYDAADCRIFSPGLMNQADTRFRLK
jgi:hypothetical protein